MAKVTFSDGTTIEFSRTPTQKEIEAAAMNLGLTKPTLRQKFDETLMGGFQSIMKAPVGLARTATAVSAALNPFKTLADYEDSARVLSEKTGIETRQLIPGTQQANSFNEQFLTPKNKYQAGGQLAGDIGQFFLAAPATGITGAQRLVVAPLVDTAIQVSQDVGAGNNDPQELMRNAMLTAGTSIMAGVFMPVKKLNWGKMAASGALTGYVSDVATGLSGMRGEDREGLKSLIPGAGTALGTAVGVGTGGLVRFSSAGREGKIIDTRYKSVQQLEHNYPSVRRAFDNAREQGYDPVNILVHTDALNGSTDAGGKISMGRAMNRLDLEMEPMEPYVYNKLKEDGTTITVKQYAKGLTEILQTSRLQMDERVALQTKIAKLIEVGKEIAKQNGGVIPLYKLQARKTSLGAQIRTQYGTVRGSTNKEVVRAYKEIIEKFSPNMDVKAYNQILQQLYTFRAVLKSLDGKIVEGGRLGRWVQTALGSYIGGQVGGPVWAALGAEIGFRGKSAANLSHFGKKNTPFVKGEFEKAKKKTAQSENIRGKRTTAQTKNNIQPKTSISKTIPQKKGLVTRAVESVKKSLKNPSVGLAIKDVSGPADESIRVGLSPVKGAVGGKYDDLVTKADALFAEGKFDDATKIYAQIAQGAQKTVQDRFKRTNIKVKFNSVGFGVYEGVPEPNIDFSATVKPEDMDLFHNILSDISQKDFNQHSFVTYKQTRIERDRGYGIIDEAKGISREPHFVFRPEKPLTLADVKKINEALANAELPAMSIKEGGNRVDVLHLTGYDKDYEIFSNKIHDFIKNLDSSDVNGTYEYATAEVRFVGDKGSSANTTYERSRGAFYKENKGFIKPDDIESKVLDAIRYKPTISKKELESIVKSGDISPTEKAVFADVLSEMKDGQMKAVEVQSRLRGKLLSINPTESTSYTNYGWDSVLKGDYEGKAVVFDSNFKHGKGQSHYQAEGLFGHSRYAITEEPVPMMKNGERIGTKTGRVATIGELQSDFFQHDQNIDLFKDPDKFYQYTTDQINRLKSTISTLKEQARNRDISSVQRNVLNESIKKDESLLAELKRQIKPLEIERNLEFAKKNLNRYERLLAQWVENPAKTDNATKNYKDMIQASKETVASLEAEAKANPVRPDVLREQFLNFARSNQYRQRLFEETVDYIMKTDKPDVIRVAKPSMVAKIEGYMGSGDDIAPYENHGGFGRNADDLTYGDEVGFLGEEYIVVGVQAQGRGWDGPPPTMIGIAPADKVNKFRLSDHIDGEVQYRIDEVNVILKDMKDSDVLTYDVLTDIADQSWPADQLASKYIKDFDVSEYPTKEKFVEEAEEFVREKVGENALDDLNDIYGQDKVFSDERGYDPMVYVVQDDVEVEWHGQPSSYTMDRSPIDVDESPAVMREMLPEYEGILSGYFDLHNKIIPKYEQKVGQKFTDGTMETPDYTGEMGYAEFTPDYSRQQPPKKTF